MPLPTDLVGLPATQLADTLEDVLAAQEGSSPPSGPSAGLLGLAETLRTSLGMADQVESGEPPPESGAANLLPELCIVDALLADVPRAGRNGRSGTAFAASPENSSPTERLAIPEVPDGSDLNTIRDALRTFAGDTLPDQVFHEVMAITAALAGGAYPTPATGAEPPPLKVRLKAGRRTRAARPPTAAETPPADPGAVEPLPLKVRLKAGRRPKAKPKDALAQDQASPAEPVSPLKVKVKPSRRRKVPSPAAAPEPAVEAASLVEAPPEQAQQVEPPLGPEPAPEPVPSIGDELPLGEDAGLAKAVDEAEPESSPAPEAPAASSQGELAAAIEAMIFAHRPSDAPMGTIRGETTLPERSDALSVLLADQPPASDFAALDLLTACWGKGAHEIKSRALLAVAQNLSRNFGLPDKLPMASCRAWKMLDAQTFQEELAYRLEAVGAFIADWQREQRHFLILEFGEIELIEHLFESLDVADHIDLLANVMNFKVLSNRRLGLLRRVPSRVRKQVQAMLPERHEEALLLLAHTKALLEKVAAPDGFAPIIATAGKALEEIDKLMKQAAAASAPPPPVAGGGMALGRIG